MLLADVIEVTDFCAPYRTPVLIPFQLTLVMRLHLDLRFLIAAVPLGVLASSAQGQHHHWLHSFGSVAYDAVTGGASDGTGGVFVTGFTGGMFAGPFAGGTWDGWVARYEGDGTQLWARQFGTSAIDYSMAAAPDGAGGVFIAGSTTGGMSGANAGGLDAWIARYDAQGGRTWVVQTGTVESDGIGGVASDGSGGLFVVGATDGDLATVNQGLGDAWVARYDATGARLWIRQFGSNLPESAFGATADGSGGVFVAGSTYGSLAGPSAGSDDAWVAHFDGAGVLSWMRQLGTHRRDYAFDLATDGAGGVYVCGSTQGDLAAANPSPGQGDPWVARYDGLGNQLWVRQFTSNGSDAASGAQPDGSGGVVVGGKTRGSLFSANLGIDDAWLARLDGAGNEVWSSQFGTALGDEALPCATDGASDVFVGGYSFGDLGGPNLGDRDGWLSRVDTDLLGERYCSPGALNSTGLPGVIDVDGSSEVASNNLVLFAYDLPAHAFGFFLCSQDRDFVVQPGGSQGHLCLGGAIGRFVAPGQIQDSGASGAFQLAVDLQRMPTSAAWVAAQAGETWNFQAWHRDSLQGVSTSNLTSAVGVTMR